MEVVWYAVLAALIGVYVLLDGYDLGAGMAYVFYADTDEEKKKVDNSIRSIWDANEVWLMAFMGLLYVVFPKFASVIIQNFGGYIILFFLFLLLKTLLFNLLVVFSDKPKLKIFLDWMFGFFNLSLVLFISIIFANIIRGIYVESDMDTLNFFSKSFSPFSGELGLLDWFTVLATAVIFIAIMIHGLSWVVLKNTGAFNRKLKKIMKRLAILELILMLMLIVAWKFLHPNIFDNYLYLPFLFIFPILVFTSLSGLIGVRSYPGENKGFILSTNLIIFSWISTLIVLYPNFMMSMDDMELSVYSAGFNSPERFYMKWVLGGLAVVLFVYSILIHKYQKGKQKE